MTVAIPYARFWGPLQFQSDTMDDAIASLIGALLDGAISRQEAIEAFQSIIEDDLEESPDAEPEQNSRITFTQFMRGGEPARFANWNGPITGPRGGVYYQNADTGRKWYRKTKPGTGREVWKAAKQYLHVTKSKGLHAYRDAKGIYDRAIRGEMTPEEAAQQFAAIVGKFGEKVREKRDTPPTPKAKSRVELPTDQPPTWTTKKTEDLTPEEKIEHEKYWKEISAKDQATEAAKRAAAREQAAKLVGKDIAAHMIEPPVYIAKRHLELLAPLRKDLAKLEKAQATLKELDSQEYKSMSYEQKQSFIAKVDKLIAGTKALRKKYRPNWMEKGKDPVALDTAVDELNRQIKDLEFKLEYNVPYVGNVRIDAEHREAVSLAAERGEHIPDEVVDHYWYVDSVFPKGSKYRRRAEGLQNIKDFETHKQKYAKTLSGQYQQKVAKSVASIKERLPKLIETAGEVVAKKRIEDLQKHADTLIEKYNAAPADEQSEEILSEIKATARKLTEEYDSLHEVRQKTGREWLRKHFGIKRRGSISITGGNHLEDRGKANMAEAVEFITSLTGAKIDVKINELEGARANAGHGQMSIMANQNTSTIVHEFGHIIEHADKDRIGSFSKGFWWTRMQNEKVDQLGDHYDAHEVGARDGWRHDYIGKHYQSIGSTEVISMGLQYLYEDPVAFAREDPEHFAYTIAALQERF